MLPEMMRTPAHSYKKFIHQVENDDEHSLRWWSAQCDSQWSISELKTMEWRMLETLDWNLSTSLNCSSSYQSFLAELSSFVFV